MTDSPDWNCACVQGPCPVHDTGMRKENSKWAPIRLDGCTWQQKARNVLQWFAAVIVQAEYSFEDQADDDRICELTTLAEHLANSMPADGGVTTARQFAEEIDHDLALACPSVCEFADAYHKRVCAGRIQSQTTDFNDTK